MMMQIKFLGELSVKKYSEQAKNRKDARRRN